MSLEDAQIKDIITTQVSATEGTRNDVDSAWKFLDHHRDVAASNMSVDIDALRRKIDWHIVPLMFCCYTMQFLDKVILNVRDTNLPYAWISKLTRTFVFFSTPLLWASP